jgi:pimeloyl-ACP methyl ester carboxylesterase
VYTWFRKHLQGKDGSSVEEPKFVPVPPKELSVFDPSHPRPADEVPAGKLREAMAKASDAQLVKPDAAIIRTWATALTGGMPANVIPKAGPFGSKVAGVQMHRAVLGRFGEPDAVPSAGVFGTKPGDTLVVWVHPKGKQSLLAGDKLVAPVQKLVDAGYSVVAGDVFGVGEATPTKARPVDRGFAGYTYGYNRRPMADQARDILTLVGFGAHILKAKTIHLIGWDNLGPATLLARSVCGDKVAKTAVDLNQLDFNKVASTTDANLLPGAIKYGGLGSILAACAPAVVLAHNHSGSGTGQVSKAAYTAAGAADKLTREPGKLTADKVVAWLVGV